MPSRTTSNTNFITNFCLLPSSGEWGIPLRKKFKDTSFRKLDNKYNQAPYIQLTHHHMHEKETKLSTIREPQMEQPWIPPKFGTNSEHKMPVKAVTALKIYTNMKLMLIEMVPMVTISARSK